MLEPQDEARANREAYNLFHVRKREIVTDGTRISIHHQKLDQAQQMYDRLALGPDGDYDQEPFARN